MVELLFYVVWGYGGLARAFGQQRRVPSPVVAELAPSVHRSTAKSLDLKFALETRLVTVNMKRVYSGCDPRSRALAGGGAGERRCLDLCACVRQRKARHSRLHLFATD